MELLFVYGTLKQGCSNHLLLKDARFIQTDSLVGRLYFFGHHSFPYAICANIRFPHYRGELPRILGEVYEVTPELLARLDRVEGVPNHYQRDHQYETDKGLWVWIYQPSEMTRLGAVAIEVLESGSFPPDVT